jgi:uncharacterized protein YbjT (DUF2867 family)
MMTDTNKTNQQKLTLVLGATGKTGSRVANRLKALDVPVRLGSRKGNPPFEWEDRNTWAPVLENVESVYVVFYPDLAVAGAPDTIRAFTDLAVKSGVKRMVLLSGRGEEEARRCELIVENSGIDWTILRASWFSQNFSEGFFREPLISGELALPAGNIGEPFIDVDDIADVAVAALTEDGHAGQLYELTGPRLLTFEDAIAEISAAVGRPIAYTRITNEDFTDGLASQEVPEGMIELMNYLFTTVLDGRNEHLNDGVQRALGREPRDFSDYVKKAAGSWQEEGVSHAG